MKSSKQEGLETGSLEELVLALCLSSLDKKTRHKIRGKRKMALPGFLRGQVYLRRSPVCLNLK